MMIKFLDDIEGRLSWFDLTDGWFWLEVGDKELFRYTESSLWREVVHPYVDYPVVRLWEDLLEILPEVMESVPPDLIEILAADLFVDLDCEELPAEADPVIAWYASHALDTGYLTVSPSIRWWTSRENDTCYMRWNHRHDAKIQFTETGSGGIQLPINAFLYAVRDFDQRLMATVAERITALQSRKTPRDFTLLAEELTNRSHWLERSAARAPTTNWNTVRQSVTWLNQARPGWAHLG